MRLVSYEGGCRSPRVGSSQPTGGSTTSGARPFRTYARTTARSTPILRGGLLDQVQARGGRGHAGRGGAASPPVARPGKIVCLGLNYRSHAEEAGQRAARVPTFFAKFANALAPPGADVPLPAYSEKVDYEAEVAFVIGRRCKDVPEAGRSTASPGTRC